MVDSPFRPVTMTGDERRQFVQKAKADRLAFDSAQLLSQGENDKAAALAGECTTLVGPEEAAHWLRHYAMTRFKLPSGTVDEFLGNVPTNDVAL